MGTRWGCLAAAGLLCLGVAARADDAAGPVPETSAADIAADIAKLIPRLDDAEFSQRQAASQELMEAGKTVFPQLEKAALEGSREASGRALDILKTHFTRGDDDTKQAAKAALERLAKSSNAGAAQRANDVLNPPKLPDPLNAQFGALPIIRGANIQIQVAAGNIPAMRRSVTIKDINGQREIEVVENDKKTKIIKSPNGSIEAEITEKQNGKEVTRKVQAKDLDDLKKKDADAAKIYEQYSQNGIGNIQIQAGFAPGLPGIPNAPNLPAEVRDQTIKNMERQIEQLKAQAATNPAAQRLVDLLQDRKKALEQQAQAEKAGAKPAETKPAESKPAAETPAPAEKPADK
jgi:hypothetical protein